jgi:hypothetical protein
VTKWVPGRAVILNSPRLFSDSFLNGQVVQIFSALTKACSPILKSEVGVRQQSVGHW